MTQGQKQFSSMHRVGIEAPMRDVAGKVAFITGGDSGIGLGITRALVDAGMKVVITYRTVAHLDEARGALTHAWDRIHAIELDVTDRAAVVAAAQETVRVYEKVHVLINNAGVAPLLPLSSSTFDDWDWCMSVNLDGVFNCIRAFLPYLKENNEGGQIVATSSMLGGLLAGPLWGAYSASKFAVVGMMEALRAELAGTHIGVSIFCPAGVKSNLAASDRNRPAAFAKTGMQDADALAPLERFSKEVQRVLENEVEAVMAPAEAGEKVLQGIRNNDLYILSHPEYAQALRERCEALLASIPKDEMVNSGRIAISHLSHTSIYVDELNRRSARQARAK